jgi:hypothetical protein
MKVSGRKSGGGGGQGFTRHTGHTSNMITLPQAWGPLLPAMARYHAYISTFSERVFGCFVCVWGGGGVLATDTSRSQRLMGSMGPTALQYF